jgi:hypothetical protein
MDTNSPAAAEEEDTGDQPTQAWAGSADEGQEEGEVNDDDDDNEEAPTQAIETSASVRSDDDNDDQPTQAYGKSAGSGDEDMMETQAAGTEGYDPDDGHDSQSQIATQVIIIYAGIYRYTLLVGYRYCTAIGILC